MLFTAGSLPKHEIRTVQAPPTEKARTRPAWVAEVKVLLDSVKGEQKESDEKNKVESIEFTSFDLLLAVWR